MKFYVGFCAFVWAMIGIVFFTLLWNARYGGIAITVDGKRHVVQVGRQSK